MEEKPKKTRKKKHVFWYRVELTGMKQRMLVKAGFILRRIECSCDKDGVQVFTDEGLLSLIGAGIQKAFKDVDDEADAEGSAEA